MQDRAGTGIPGLDELLEGGFPRGDTILVTGTPGTGKTTMSFQYVIEGARKYGERGIILTLDKEPEKLKQRFQRFGWDMDELIREGKILLLDPEIRPEYGEDPLGWIESKEIRDTIDRFQPQRVAVDSLTLLLQYSMEHGGFRRGVRMLLDTFRFGCTTLFIHEREHGRLEDIEYLPEEFMVDGIVYLHFVRREDELRRALTVLKMRGTNHPLRIMPVRIDDGGLSVHPEERIFG